jgi:hypothetical protein
MCPPIEAPARLKVSSPSAGEQHLVVLDVVGHLVERRVAALAEVRVVGAEHAELVRQRTDPLEAVKCPAAVEVHQRLALADRIGHRLDPVDAVDDAVEPLCAVGPLAHALSGSCLRGRHSAGE